MTRTRGLPVRKNNGQSGAWHSRSRCRSGPARSVIAKRATAAARARRAVGAG